MDTSLPPFFELEAFQIPPDIPVDESTSQRAEYNSMSDTDDLTNVSFSFPNMNPDDSLVFDSFADFMLDSIPPLPPLEFSAWSRPNLDYRSDNSQAYVARMEFP